MGVSTFDWEDNAKIEAIIQKQQCYNQNKISKYFGGINLKDLYLNQEPHTKLKSKFNNNLNLYQNFLKSASTRRYMHTLKNLAVSLKNKSTNHPKKDTPM